MEYLCKDVFYQFNNNIWTYLYSLEKIQRSNQILDVEKKKYF